MSKFILFLIILTGCFSFAFSQIIDVLGYLPSYRFEAIPDIDFSKVTHVDIAFANPDENGNLDVDNKDIDPIVENLKNNDIVVYISLGGADVYGQLAKYWKNNMSPSLRSQFIKKIKDYCINHNFDGVDMDLEWDNITGYYSPFVLELKDTLSKYSLGLTAALPGTFRYSQITDQALKAFDVINLMAYDFTGPWAPNNPGQHSSYKDAQRSITFWKNQGVNPEKLRLGVPFYGYDFTDTGNITSFTYSDIVAENTDYAYVDNVGEKYYNGINTIRKKTKLAKEENLKGIMIWELTQDAFAPYEEYSLLKAINEEINGNDNVIINRKSALYPNPFIDRLYINVDFVEKENKAILKINDLNGKTIYKQPISSNEIIINKIKPGLYFYSIISKNKIYIGKIVKTEERN